MAFQENRLSSLPITDHFLAPDDQENQLLMDFEWGGIGINDPSEGLRYQYWTLRYYPGTGDMVLSAPNTAPTTLWTRSDITEISLAFDQNMQPFVAFVEAGQAKFYWWDTNIAAFTYTNLPSGSLTPRCCGADDKRETQTDASDIILCYVYSGDLKMRRQRDRYTIEYTLESPFIHPQFELPAVLERVGMNKQNRLQWLCDLANPLDWCGYKAEVN